MTVVWTQTCDVTSAGHRFWWHICFRSQLRKQGAVFQQNVNTCGSAFHKNTVYWYPTTFDKIRGTCCQNDNWRVLIHPVQHISKWINWDRQGKSSSSLTDELVSTAVTELPGLMWIPVLGVRPSCHEKPCGDLTPGPPADITQQRSWLLIAGDSPVAFYLPQRKEKRCKWKKRQAQASKDHPKHLQLKLILQWKWNK